MKLLLDTNILLAMLEKTLAPAFNDALVDEDNDLVASVASLWEIAIKVRLGKLPIKTSLEQIPDAIAAMDIALMTIEVAHVLANVDPLPPTRDPFDRLLLAQCAVENMQLVTTDRALVSHPLAWRMS